MATPVIRNLIKKVERPKVRAFGTYEQVPGAGIGHLEELIGQPYSVRKQFSESPLSSWDKGGADALYGALNQVMRPSRGMVGAFTPEGGSLEINPGMVARFEAPMDTGEVARALRNMSTAESGRAYVDAQNAGAGHMVFPIDATPDAEKTSLIVSLGRSPSQSEMGELAGLADRYGFFPVDTGKGLSFINNPYSDVGGSRTAESLRSFVDSPEGGMIGQAVGSGEATPARIDSVYEPYQSEFAERGSGKATEKFLADMFANKEAADAMEPALRSKAGANYLRDQQMSQQTGFAVREDIQLARRILLEHGISGLKRALESGVVLPAVAAAVLMPQQRER